MSASVMNFGDFVATLLVLLIPILVIVILFIGIKNAKKEKQVIHQKLDLILKKLDEKD